MYFQTNDFLYLQDDKKMVYSQSWTFQLWITPIDDVIIADEQQIISFQSKDLPYPQVEVVLGPNCKCVSVRINNDDTQAVASH